MRKGASQKPFATKAIRFNGIRTAAKSLGVNENHLRMVLQGKRESKVLTARVRKQFPALLGAA